MNMKKIIAIAATAIMAAGVCTGLPTGTENTPALAITAEAANSDFVIKTDDDGYKYVAGYKGKGGDITIPKEVVYIGKKAFYGNDKITSVTIPKTCNGVGEFAFSTCVNLKKVVVEGDITIATDAFDHCVNLESVTVKGSIQDSIGSYAFFHCDKLKTVKIKGNKNNFVIRREAFMDCFSLTSINIPSKCTEIYGGAFLNCFNLAKLTIPAKTKINTENGQDSHFGYVNVYGEHGWMTFVADGKTSCSYNRYITKEEAVKTGTHYTMIYGCDVLASTDYEEITPRQLTLTVTKGSPAEKWAKESGVKYVYAKSSSSKKKAASSK